MNIGNASRSMTFAVGIAAALFNSVLAAQAQPAAASTGQPSDEGCSAAVLRGTYVVSFDGQGTSAPPQFSESAFFPISVLGTLTFGGNGIVYLSPDGERCCTASLPGSGSGQLPGRNRLQRDHRISREFRNIQHLRR